MYKCRKKKTALKGRNMSTMGAAHRNETEMKTPALKGRNTLTMGAAHRNEWDHEQYRQP